MMGNFSAYQCSLCGQSYTADQVEYVCPEDGGNLDIVLDYAAIQTGSDPDEIRAAGEYSMWRYLPLLPVGDPGFVGTPLRAVGWTPVYAPPRLAAELGVKSVWVKDESRNPTASFKDRASALVVARARELSAEVIVTASSGNAGAALAGMAAAVGQQTVILVPKSAPPAKIAQLLVYGAQVLLVDGNYDDAFDLSLEASQEFGWYCRNTGYNPFTLEGKKTAAYEIWEQVLCAANPERPLCIFVSVGDGNIIAGLHKGFKELHALGWLAQMPRIFGVQAQGSAAVAHAYQAGVENIQAVSADTLADSIAVDLPRDGLRALRAATQTGGAYLTVSDDEILQAISALGRAGIFAEPAAAASYAGLSQAVAAGQIAQHDPVLALVTGSGLKDVHAAMQAAGNAAVIVPTLEALKKA
ncbi:MAG: threonine synthase, partial [Anaerolineae bacterium]|nr:threonine synthase [Anaerolineae bacterium]